MTNSSVSMCIGSFGSGNEAKIKTYPMAAILQIGSEFNIRKHFWESFRSFLKWFGLIVLAVSEHENRHIESISNVSSCLISLKMKKKFYVWTIDRSILQFLNKMIFLFFFFLFLKTKFSNYSANQRLLYPATAILTIWRILFYWYIKIIIQMTMCRCGFFIFHSTGS